MFTALLSGLAAIASIGSWGTIAAVGTGVAAGVGAMKVAEMGTEMAHAVKDMADALKGAQEILPEDATANVAAMMTDEEPAEEPAPKKPATKKAAAKKVAPEATEAEEA